MKVLMMQEVIGKHVLLADAAIKRRYTNVKSYEDGNKEVRSLKNRYVMLAWYVLLTIYIN